MAGVRLDDLPKITAVEVYHPAARAPRSWSKSSERPSGVEDQHRSLTPSWVTAGESGRWRADEDILLLLADAEVGDLFSVRRDAAGGMDVVPRVEEEGDATRAMDGSSGIATG